MKKTVAALSVLIGAALLGGCGGASNTNAAANTNSNKSNGNQTLPSSTPSSTDAAPVTMSVKDLGNVDAQKALVGKTLLFKTEGLKNWTEESLMVSYTSNSVTCKGDFSKYKDAIKAFQDAKDFIYVDFKGVADSVDDRGSSVNLNLKDCSIIKVEK